jgi:acyl carrier protein
MAKGEHAMDSLEKIRKILKEKLDTDPKDVLPQKALTELGLDSLDMYEMIYEIETEFGVKIPDSEIANLTTVGDLINFIESKK